ncbi:helix-turn-helix domain-containing protein [Hydrogenophaga sp.]|uniref:helix-turn-helix domain-containing protein n=1 Tax=Hydrogenophaga sp. TaxID=1904254 RepID=UPI003D0F0B17
MTLQRLPTPALRPFVVRLWASDERVAQASDAAQVREHMLPTGAMHLVFRLTDSPLLIADRSGGAHVQALGPVMVGGARSRFYMRESRAPSCSVGAMLHPGTSLGLFGVTADELAQQHTPLDLLWGASALELHERLLEARGPEARLLVFESALLARLPRVHGLHPAIAGALAPMACGQPVAEAVRRSGVSHRRFIELFRQDVGLTPKAWQRVQRFQRALPALGERSDGAVALASLAADSGYSDQSHFNRDFLAFAGVTPLAYRARAGVEANHLPVDERFPVRRG